MGYLFLSIALFAGAAKGFCGKKTSGYTKGLRDAIGANLLRMLLCSLIGLVLILAAEGPGNLIPSGRLLLIAALSGVSTSVFVVSWLVAVKKSAYMLLDIFLMLGILIPLGASSLLFHESITLTQWIGIGVLFCAVVIMCSYNNGIKAKLTPGAFLLLLLCGISCGIADFSQKLFTKLIPGGSAAVFNFYTYLFSALTLVIVFALTGRKEAAGGFAFRKIFGWILAMAIFLFANSYFKTLATDRLDAVLLYPLNQGCSLILAALMSSVLFKEKLTVKAIIGIAAAFIGLLIINLL